jgi:hypothetical protein
MFSLIFLLDHLRSLFFFCSIVVEPFTIALTISIISATHERSFSAMKKIKTWLRTLLVQDRFSDFSILYIEKDISKNIKSDDILNIFADTNKYLSLKLNISYF